MRQSQGVIDQYLVLRHEDMKVKPFEFTKNSLNFVLNVLKIRNSHNIKWHRHFDVPSFYVRFYPSKDIQLSHNTCQNKNYFVLPFSILSYCVKIPLNGTHFEDQKMILFCHKTVFFVSRENEKTEMARNTRCKWLLLLPESP